MNKKLFFICSFMAATAIASERADSQVDFKARLTECFSFTSKPSFDPVAGRKLLSILKPINESYQQASETMKNQMDEYKIDPYSFNGMLALSALSAYLGLGRWVCVTSATLLLMNLEAIIHMLEKDLEEFEKNSQEQQKS